MKFPSSQLCADMITARLMKRKPAVEFLFGSASAEGYLSMEARELTVWALAIPMKERGRHLPKEAKKPYSRQYVDIAKASAPEFAETPDRPKEHRIDGPDVWPALIATATSGWRSTRKKDMQILVAKLTPEQRRWQIKRLQSDLRQVKVKKRILKALFQTNAETNAPEPRSDAVPKVVETEG